MLGLRLDEPLPLAGLEQRRSTRRARADGGGRARGRAAWTGGRGDPHADAARPVPRRRGHGRAARLRPRVPALRRGVAAAVSSVRHGRRRSPFVPDELRAAAPARSAARSCSSRSGRSTTRPTTPPGRRRSRTSRRRPASPGGSWPHEMSARREPRAISRCTRATSRSAAGSPTPCSTRTTGDVIGCVYIYPRGAVRTTSASEPIAHDASVRSWVRADRGGARRAALARGRRTGSRRTGRSSASRTRRATDGAARPRSRRSATAPLPGTIGTPWNSSPPAGARSCGGWSKSTSRPASPSGRNRSSSERAWTCRRRPCAASWPSSRRSGS